MKEKRKEQVRKRKNFFPTLLLTILLWVLLVGFVYFSDPGTFFMVPIFFFLSFLALLFSFSIIFSGTRRGFVCALGLTFFLVLRFFGIGNIINLLLILGLGITIEFYILKH